MSLEIILPFLQPIAHLISNPGISEIMVNGNGHIFIQQAGRLEEVAANIDERFLATAIKRMARSLGQDINEAQPLLDCRLEDGSRVAAAFPPASPFGTTFTIRKFRPHWFTLDQLVDGGALPASVAALLRQAVQQRRTILLSGGTGTGKTTFTKALLDLIPPDERLGVIEDTIELKIDRPNVFRFEARQELRSRGEVVASAITIRDLVKSSLRHRPDRLIIGEVRGAEAFDLLDALNTGHVGSISTLHANSAMHGLSRLASLAIRADAGVPHKALQVEVGDLIDYAVHIRLQETRRFVSEVLQVHRFDSERNQYEITDLYRA